LKPILPLLALGLSIESCSFTTATGFQECSTDTECGNAKVCVQSKYCLPLPSGCSLGEGAFDKPDRIPLVALLPINDNGVAFEAEQQRFNAMRLAVRQVNAAGGIQGKLFALYLCDTDRKNETLNVQLDWVLRELQPPAVFTSGSAQTEAAANNPQRVAAKTLVVSATATSAALTGLFDTTKSIWRIAPPDSLQAKVLARLISKPYGAEYSSDAGLSPDPRGAVPDGGQVAIVYERGPYGQGFADALTRELPQYPGISFVEFTPPFDGAKIEDVVRAKPSATAVIAFSNDVKTIITASAPSRLGNKHRWVFADGAKALSVVTDVTRSELKGNFGTAPAQGKGPLYSFFKGQMLDQFKVNSDNFSFISHSYDAAYVVMYAAVWASVQSGGLTGENMAGGMQQLTNKTGVSIELTPTQWSRGRTQLLSQTAIDVQGASGELDFLPKEGAPIGRYEFWQFDDQGKIVSLADTAP
jgi:branched-chain amino acid transport system substrate-binding protein